MGQLLRGAFRSHRQKHEEESAIERDGWGHERLHQLLKHLPQRQATIGLVLDSPSGSDDSDERDGYGRRRDDQIANEHFQVFTEHFLRRKRLS